MHFKALVKFSVTSARYSTDEAGKQGQQELRKHERNRNRKVV